MNRRPLVLAAAAVVVAAAAGSACALADPGNESPSPATGPPHAGASCSADLDGTVTPEPQPDAAGTTVTLLQCAGGTWDVYSAEYPSSDSWLSTGAELVLHGQGTRNAEFMAGAWTGTPQATDEVCRAEYLEAIPETRTGETHTLAAEPGQPLTFEASTRLSTITLSGYCLWQRDG